MSDHDLYEWITGGKGELHLDKERLRADFGCDDLEEAFDVLSRPQDAGEERNEELDWLEGREAHGYYVDMLFAQQYARWNRELMSEAICDELNVQPADWIESIHNYIDFRGLTIRKGQFRCLSPREPI